MSEWVNLESQLVSRLACPVCGSGLDYQPPEEEASCRKCNITYLKRSGIWRMLTEEQREYYRPFTDNYQTLRQAEGWERTDPAYYLGLPQVLPGDPQASIWRIRRRSLKRLQKEAGQGRGSWGLDLGAGNGWLSRYLVRLGYRAVGLDLNTNGPDSLEGGLLYQQHENIWFGRVQAGLERLPFQEGVFSLCAASGSLHYAALEPALAEIWRVLAIDGKFILTDSPVYRQAAAGRAMRAEYVAQTQARFGREARWVGGSGYLVESELLAGLARAGFEVKIFGVERYMGRLRRKIVGWFNPAPREMAHFPVLVARKTARPVELQKGVRLVS
jgi:SAM-dependent methyltransferase